MRLRLELPPGAVERPLESGGFEIVLPGRDWLRIEVAPLVVCADDRATWIVRQLGDVHVVHATSTTTVRGSPVEIIDTYVATEHLVEHCLIAIYDMLGHAGTVRLHAVDGSRYAGSLESLLMPIVLRAWPDWRSREPVALAELWSLDLTPTNS